MRPSPDTQASRKATEAAIPGFGAIVVVVVEVVVVEVEVVDVTSTSATSPGSAMRVVVPLHAATIIRNTPAAA